MKELLRAQMMKDMVENEAKKNSMRQEKEMEKQQYSEEPQRQEYEKEMVKDKKKELYESYKKALDAQVAAKGSQKKPYKEEQQYSGLNFESYSKQPKM
jgi:hypothetical protein